MSTSWTLANAAIPPHIMLEARGEPSAIFRVSLLNPLHKPKPAWAFKTEVLESGGTKIVSRGVRCLSPSSPPIFAIDNLDSALNLRLLTRLVSRLATWLAATDPDRQLLFTAHNPAVLDGLALEDDEVRLFAVERNSEGRTTVRRITLTPELRQLHRDYPLSRLWAMGHLGAVPNV